MFTFTHRKLFEIKQVCFESVECATKAISKTINTEC